MIESPCTYRSKTDTLLAREVEYVAVMRPRSPQTALCCGVPGVPLLLWLQDSISITGPCLWLCFRNHTCMLCCIYDTAIFAYSGYCTVFFERRLAGRLPHFLLGRTHQKRVSFLMRWHEIWTRWGTGKTAASFHWCYQVANAQASKKCNKWITNYGDDLNRSGKSWQ